MAGLLNTLVIATCKMSRVCSVFYLWSVVFTLSLTQDVALPVTINAAPSTCPLRTVNYITHDHTQQCSAGTRTALTEERGGVHSTHKEQIVELVSSLTQSPTTEYQAASTTTTLYDATRLVPPLNSLIHEHHTERVQKPIENELAPVKENTEEDFELESGNFLSFEEWKKQNLKKAGQSEHIARRNQAVSQEPRKRPSNIHNSLESLGDDGEIDIDFSGFVPGGPKSAREVTQPIAENAFVADGGDASGTPRIMGRSKDAGTTCKERFNHASFDCAANVLKTNKEAKSSNTVLSENKDSYMLNQCSAPNKFLILELCNDISIDTIVLANFEFFSSTFHTFRVGVSDRYPIEAEKWKILGTYEARNTREIQAFLVENPLIWARYVRIEFLTHYGKEFYCPVSLVRIHGKTMIEEDWKHLYAEDDNEESDTASDSDPMPVDPLIQESMVETPDTKIVESEDTVLNYPVKVATSESASSESTEYTETQSASQAVPASVIAFEAIMSVIESSDTCDPADSPSPVSSQSAPSPALSARVLSSSTDVPVSGAEPVVSAVGLESPSSIQPVTTSVHSRQSSKKLTESVSGTSTTRHSKQFISTSKSVVVSSSTDTKSIKSAVPQKERSNVVAPDKSKPSSTGPPSQKEKPTSSASDRTKSSGSPSQAQPATPTMQESFFKSVQKRLQMLESNSSLSLQYIEDQSRSLRDAFKKVEQRQLSRTTAFLDQLNQTVLNELRDFRQQYDQLWQSTVIELGMQRERYERDNEAINARLGILADEVIFQRRMAILQMVLILVCLVLVVFSRGVINNYLELPLVQNVLARSPSSKWLNLSASESPARPPQPPRIRSAHQLRNGILKGHRRMQSDDSITDNQSGTEVYAPPTPISDYGHSEVELSRDGSRSPLFESDKDDNIFEDPMFDPNSIERPSTSPPVLRINGSSLISDILETSGEDMPEPILADKTDIIRGTELSPNPVTEFVPIEKEYAVLRNNVYDTESTKAAAE